MIATRQNRRRQRQRDRRKNADARAAPPQRAGGWGQGLPVSPSNMLLARRAIREHWPVPPDVAAAVIRDVCDVALSAANPRRHVSAVRVILAAEADRQRAELAALRAARAAAARAAQAQQFARVVFYTPSPTPTRTFLPSSELPPSDVLERA